MKRKVRVARVQNPFILRVEGVQELLKRAFPVGGIIFPLGAEASALDIARMIAAPSSFGFFIGMEGHDFNGLAIVQLPQDTSICRPQVLHFYNSGGITLRNALTSAVVDFVKENGYSTFLAVNGTDHRDLVWARMFRRAGATKRVGSIMEFEV